MHIANKKKIYL